MTRTRYVPNKHVQQQHQWATRTELPTNSRLIEDKQTPEAGGAKSLHHLYHLGFCWTTWPTQVLEGQQVAFHETSGGQSNTGVYERVAKLVFTL